MRSAGVALIVTAVGVLGGCGPGPAPDATPHAPSDAASNSFTHAHHGDIERIQAHLDGALELLRTRPVDHLSEHQRATRAETVAWLREYRDQAVFPHNHVRSERVPVFVDSHGTPCAVGYLLLRSGESELVEEIATERNLVRIHELKEEPRLAAWLDERGLTLDEAARIQPAYGGPPLGPSPVPTDHDGFETATAVTSALTLVATGVAIGRDGDQVAPGWARALSVTSALAHVSMLVIANDSDQDEPDWAAAVNTAGAVLGSLISYDLFTRPGQQADGTVASSAALRVSPRIGYDDDRLGLGLTLRH